MHILQTNGSLGGVSDVGHHVERFYGVATDHVGDGGLGAWEGVMEGADAAAFVDGEAPSVGVDVGVASTAFESSVFDS